MPMCDWSSDVCSSDLPFPPDSQCPTYSKVRGGLGCSPGKEGRHHSAEICDCWHSCAQSKLVPLYSQKEGHLRLEGRLMLCRVGRGQRERRELFHPALGTRPRQATGLPGLSLKTRMSHLWREKSLAAGRILANSHAPLPQMEVIFSYVEDSQDGEQG